MAARASGDVAEPTAGSSTAEGIDDFTRKRPNNDLTETTAKESKKEMNHFRR